MLSESFANRHIGPRQSDIEAMLNFLGYDTLKEFMSAAVPANIQSAMQLPSSMSEHEALAVLSQYASRNNPGISMIGLGYHPTLTPPVIRRNVLEDPAWYTAYTPYQPEISQGRLEALINFQTMVSDLVGLPTANSSLLDEATAVAEAMTLMSRANKASGSIVLDSRAMPQTIAVVETRAKAIGIEVRVADINDVGDLTGVIGAIIAQTGATGDIVELEPLVAKFHDAGALVTVISDPLALVLLQSPGSAGADVVVGSSQRFGVPMFYGGPHAGFMAVREGLERHLPGRLVGVSKDADDRPAYRLALQTREQHIRREKATSNICTAQVLLAVTAGMYAVYHGADGLRRITQRTHHYASLLAEGLRAGGVEVVHEVFFDTVLARVSGKAESVVKQARERGIHVRLVDDDHVGISTSEATNYEDLVALWEAFGVAKIADDRLRMTLPSNLLRADEILTHEVFNKHRSETQMLRYLRKLSDRDYALDRGMIPLGSCTMKLNAAAEMEPISWPQFANLHPFVPAEDAAGSIAMINELEEWLAVVTGYAKVSIQPNAGSQGEFSGLMAIAAYHRSRGDENRKVCLIPSSAHGTNAASAVMAGMRVVVVKADEDGSVDMNDLRTKCELHSDELAAIMVTYPSTHGVYEPGIRELCDVVHQHGGQVYIDGANLNALLGHAKPGEFGGDVSHLNLHKTFAIPHGGGGPGVGPVGVAAHLVNFLPSHPMHPEVEKRSGIGAISAAPYGSAGILQIPWAYIAMMGSEGLTDATSVAVLSANYIAKRLQDAYPILYVGDNGLVAHECIIDVRATVDGTPISIDDVAKRLIDYGLHAPTMSFPVAGTLMIEPTESEDLGEIDRFCDAMLAIASEIEKVRTGEFAAEDNPLVNAPHTIRAVTSEWKHAYSINEAVFPTGQSADKYWPPVSRIDQAFGDRNLVCQCPPPEAFE